MLPKHGDPAHPDYFMLVLFLAWKGTFLALSFSDVFLTITSETAQKVISVVLKLADGDLALKKPVV